MAERNFIENTAEVDIGKTGLGKLSKEEIAIKPLFSRKDKLAFMSALIFTAGSLLIHGESVSVTLTTQNAALSSAVKTLAESLTGRECRVIYKDRRNREIIIENALTLLCACKVLKSDGASVNVCEHIASEFMAEQSCAVAYIRGAYLGAGSLSAGSYHLEFSFGKKTLAEDFTQLVSRYGITLKSAVRKNRAIAYTKDSELISDCLALMGAPKAVLSLNELIAKRQMAEHINRQQNCDMHNIDKQINTGIEQCAFIKELDLNTLSPALTETAKMRLEHPDFSYEQLGVALGISKSGVKNRLKRLKQIYDKK